MQDHSRRIDDRSQGLPGQTVNRSADMVRDGFGGGSVADTATTYDIRPQAGDGFAHKVDNTLAGELGKPRGRSIAAEDIVDAGQSAEFRLVLRASHDFNLIDSSNMAPTAGPLGLQAATTILAM